MTEEERNPDRRPAAGGLVIEDRGSDVIALLKVRGHGVLVLTGDSLAESHGVSLFTDEEIQFD